MTEFNRIKINTSKTLIYRTMLDLKRVIREPILMLFMFVPFITYFVFRLLHQYGFPLLLTYTGFDANPYKPYLAAFSFLMAPSLLGTVTGFLMIDERDENIWPLMAITPIGESGYLTNRLLFPFLGSVIYAFLSQGIAHVVDIPFGLLCLLAILSGMEGIFFGLLLFRFATDKVQGLTLSKAMGIFMFFPLSSLLQLNWFDSIAGAVPFTWMGRLLVQPVTVGNVVLSLLVHIFWLLVLVWDMLRQNIR